MGLLRKSQQQLEKEFLAAARASQRMPSIDNRRKAQKAYDALPANSEYRKMKFEGVKKS